MNEPGEESERARRLSGVHLPIYEPEGVDVLDSDIDPDDDLETEDESLLESIEEEPRTVLITGACGNIGRKLRSAWADVYDLVLIDRVADPRRSRRSSRLISRSWTTIGSRTSMGSTRSFTWPPTPTSMPPGTT